MKHTENYITKIGMLVFVGILMITFCGCGGSGSTGSDYYGADSGGTAAAGYAISGRITDATSHTPISGATCALQSESSGARYSYSTTTDSSGNYSFSGVPSDNYVLIISASDYVTLNAHFTAGADIPNLSPAIPSFSGWNAAIGDTNHPYDATSGTLVIRTMNNVGASISGASVSCSPAAYSAVGYVNVATGTVDWTAASTSAAGEAFFYRVTPGQSYTITASQSDFSFTPLTGVTTIAGQISYYHMFGSEFTPMGRTISGNGTE